MNTLFTNVVRTTLVFTFMVLSFISFTQEGHKIEIQVSNFEGDSIYLGYYMGKSQYLMDTAIRQDKDLFIFSGDSALAGGMYLVVFPPENSFFQLIVNQDEQNLTMSVDAKDPNSTLNCENCIDNNLLYEYTAFLKSKRVVADSVKKLKQNDEVEIPEKSEEIELILEELDVEVRAEQERIVEEYPNSVTSAIIRAGWEPQVPDFDPSDEEAGLKRYLYYKAHYFDDLDLSNVALTRTPIFYNKINYYIERLTVQHPDSINKSLDLILDGLKQNPDAFQYYLVHYLNLYAKSKLVGMDAVYVHLVDRYYKTGLASWTSPDQLKKIIKNSDALKPTLIGQLAPPIQLEDRDGNQVSVMDSDAAYTILYFWRPDCGHCKKSTPHLLEYVKEFKGEDVQVYAICMKFTDEVETCWKYIDDNEELKILEHLVDPYHRSKFATLYNIKSTPQIFVLDKEKRILTKKIAAEKLKEVMDTLRSWTEEEESEEKEGGSK